METGVVGFVFFISNDVFCIERPDLSPIAIEILWLEIHVNHKKVLVGVCYRPPGQNRDEQNTFFSNLEMSFEMAKQSNFDVIVLLGDFKSVQQRINNVASFEIVNRDLQRLTSYGAQWLVKFNATKTNYIIIARKRNRPNHPNLILNGESISESQNHTHLGVTINNKLSWSVHINMAIAKADRRLSVIRRCRNQIPRPCRETLFKTIIRPVLDYGDIIYDLVLNRNPMY